MTFQKTTLFTVIVISALTFILPIQITQAQGPFIFELPSPDSTDITGIINSFYTSAVAIAGIAAMVMIVIGSIYYVVSRGSQDKQREGKDIITSAVWGVVLLLGAYTILNTINPELVSLTPPGGPAPFCKTPPERQVCTEGQESTPEVPCCISQSVLVERPTTTCPESLMTGCILSNTVSDEVSSPRCDEQDKTPSCIGPMGGDVPVPHCGYEGTVFNRTPIPTICDQGGLPQCVSGTPTCVIASINQVWIPNCSSSFDIGSCAAGWEQWDSVTLIPGAKYLQYVYYPRNGTTTAASLDDNGNPQGQGTECVIYAYQKGSSDNLKWEYTDLNGLGKC